MLSLFSTAALANTSGKATAKTAPAPLKTSAGGTTYYVDAETGRDTYAGTSPNRAWRTIARINRAALAPGDQILLAGGQSFTGTIILGQARSGSLDNLITFGSYGRGRAEIDAGAHDGVTLTDCSYIVIRDLIVNGCGRKNGSDGVGVRLTRTSNVSLTSLEARGFRLAGISTAGDSHTRITHVWAHDNGFAGITAYGDHDGIPRSRDLYIGYCVADDNPGDPKNLTSHSGNGIVVGGVDRCLIEYCEASNNGWDMPRKGNGPVGIWGWNCDRLVIQHCIAHDNKSPGDDGDGFDFDGGVTNSILQYNLSYNNQGTGYLLCQYPNAAPWHDNIMRYNISIGDGEKNFQSGIGLWLGDKGISTAEVYNNTVINPWHAVVTWGDIPGVVYKNNVFVAGGDMLVGDFTHSRFENNLYYFTGEGAFYRDGDTVYKTLSEWANATGQEMVGGALAGMVADPQLELPAVGARLPTDPVAMHEMAFFRPLAGSPCLGAGAAVPIGDTQDFFGAIPAGHDRFLGAGQATAPRQSGAVADDSR